MLEPPVFLEWGPGKLHSSPSAKGSVSSGSRIFRKNPVLILCHLPHLHPHKLLSANNNFKLIFETTPHLNQLLSFKG